MKNHYHALLLIAAIVLGIIGTAGAAEEAASNLTPVTTNVWFARMTETNNSYLFEVLPTGYIGLNDYGRMTFVAGARNMSTGEYAIVQQTRNGTALLKVLRITKSGDIMPEYTMLTLELNDEDLVEPLQFPAETGTDKTTLSQAASTTTPVPIATKAPVSMATIMAGLCIAGFIGTLRLRR
jgi:hypothetical protein